MANCVAISLQIDSLANWFTFWRNFYRRWCTKIDKYKVTGSIKPLFKYRFLVHQKRYLWLWYTKIILMHRAFICPLTNQSDLACLHVRFRCIFWGEMGDKKDKICPVMAKHVMWNFNWPPNTLAWPIDHVTRAVCVRPCNSIRKPQITNFSKATPPIMLTLIQNQKIWPSNLTVIVCHVRIQCARASCKAL